MPNVRLLVFGKVQGVFFRAETKKLADQLGIKGYVKNLSDGSVEIMAQGDKQAIKELQRWVKVGPKIAEVEKITLESISPSNQFKKFSIEK